MSLQTLTLMFFALAATMQWMHVIFTLSVCDHTFVSCSLKLAHCQESFAYIAPFKLFINFQFMFTLMKKGTGYMLLLLVTIGPIIVALALSLHVGYGSSQIA